MTSRIPTEAVEAASISVGTKATFVGGGGAVVSSFLQSNLLGICGLLIAALGYLTSVYFQRRKDARDQIEHERRMRKWDTRPAPLEGDRQ